MHLPVRPLLSGFLAAALLSGAATAAPPPVPPAEVPRQLKERVGELPVLPAGGHDPKSGGHG